MDEIACDLFDKPHHLVELLYIEVSCVDGTFHQFELS
jgi:hypothetical protein